MYRELNKLKKKKSNVALFAYSCTNVLTIVQCKVDSNVRCAQYVTA